LLLLGEILTKVRLWIALRGNHLLDAEVVCEADRLDDLVGAVAIWADGIEQIRMSAHARGR